MSASSALQKAIVAALKADAGVVALVDARVYDVPPVDVGFPFVSLGPGDFMTERRDDMVARTETIQIDVWTRDERRRQPCKALMDAVTSALDQADLTLDDPYGLGRLDLVLARLLDDPDGITRHGVLQFEAEIEG